MPVALRVTLGLRQPDGSTREATVAVNLSSALEVRP